MQPFVRILTFLFPSVCAGCGKKGSPLCQDCTPSPRLLDPSRGLDALAGGAPYRGPIGKAIRSYKYRFVSSLAAPLGDIVAGAAILLPPFDAIVPVPLHPSRLRWRGFDQADLLARRVQLKTGTPVVHALRRKRSTEAQASLKGEDRQKNVSGAFEATGTMPARIVLIDDVTTTGATLRECAEAARTAGADHVSAAVIAYGA